MEPELIDKGGCSPSHWREPTPNPPSPPPPTEDELGSPRMDSSSVGFSTPPPSSDSNDEGDDDDEDDENDGNELGNLIVDDSAQRLISSVMQNPVILTNMFELCPVSVLATFRSVSKLWYDLSLPSWRSSVSLTFRKGDMFLESESYHRYISSPRFWTFSYDPDDTPFVSNLQKFFEFAEDPRNQCEQKPYKSFHLREWEFRRSQDLIDQFLSICANTITRLILNECYFYGVEGFRKVIYNTFPNLRELVLKDYKITVLNPPQEEEEYQEPCYGEHLNLRCLTIDMEHEPLPITWMELLSHFPRLTSLKLYNADLDDAGELMLKAIKIIRRKDSRKLAIKNLDVFSASLYAQEEVYPGISTLLRELQLPLEYLTIDMGVDTVATIIKDILDVYGRGLKVLNAYRGPISKPYSRFPFGIHLENLEEFYLSDRLCENMDFLRLTPKLKKLHVRTVESRPPHCPSPTTMVYNTWEPELANVRLNQLTDFRFDFILSEDDLRNLVKWMPNVERVDMILNDKQFSIVCQHWKKLVHLHVSGDLLTDEGVTGIRLYVEDMGEQRVELREMASTRPNITWLKGLRSFVMDNDGEFYPTRLMDFSALNGFLKMENLQYIRFSSQMADKTKKALSEKIPHCEVYAWSMMLPTRGKRMYYC